MQYDAIAVRRLSIPALVAPVLCVSACKVKDPPPIDDVWTDQFERDSIGESYYETGDGYRVANGALSAKGAKNHPLWMRRKIPRDVRIELEAWSTEPRGDIKIEVFGDGRSYDPDGGAYMATGYELIFGGWSNTKSIIARLDEHAPDVVVDPTRKKVVPNQHYRWKIERVGRRLTWHIDDQLFLQLDDQKPLEGGGHEYLGFNNWETDTWFDNLVITPL